MAMVGLGKLDGFCQFHARSASGAGLLRRVVIQRAEEELEIHPGAERFAGASQNQNADVIITGQPGQHIDHVVAQRRAHGVALFRPVQRDPGDLIFCLDQHIFVIEVT